MIDARSVFSVVAMSLDHYCPRAHSYAQRRGVAKGNNGMNAAGVNRLFPISVVEVQRVGPRVRLAGVNLRKFRAAITVLQSFRSHRRAPPKVRPARAGDVRRNEPDIWSPVRALGAGGQRPHRARRRTWP